VPSASDDISVAIRDAGGALRFDRFMDIALYGDHGFYLTTGRAGRRGDFITSPEVGPLFGMVLARWIEAEWAAAGRPDDFVVIECGAGPGTLARAVLAAAPQWRDRYVAVELSTVQRESHPAGVISASIWPSGPARGVIVANELLDNLPFRLAVYDGVWREVMVAESGGRFVEVTAPLAHVPAFLPASAPHGSRLPIQEGAGVWLAAARGLLRQGTVMAIDYCVQRSDDLVGRPWREWLRTYRGHDRGRHYLLDPGTQDITTHVCLDQLPAGESSSQAAFLQVWGIADLVDEGRTAWRAAAGRPDLAALAMRSRVSEAEALLDPAGLGGFSVVQWRSTGSG
jgi:SAM-dependent MidA family methyltransferase